jgi:hypothetical protein
MFEKWKTNGGIIGSKAKSCCNNFNDVFFLVGATWTFNKYNNIEK